MAIGVGTVVTAGTTQYTIGSALKSGGFGTTFLAERTTPPDKLQVVVKVPQAHVLANETWSAKFTREARILANISSPHVAKIIAYIETPDGQKAIIQEYVVGAVNVAAYIGSHPDRALSALLQTLYALRSFHKNFFAPNIVHRDISPANVLVDHAGIVKVIDFGLAKEDPRVTQVLTVTGDWFGTPGCMSPEQTADVATVDHRADIYAVGRTFAASVQNRRPEHVDISALPEPWRTVCAKLANHNIDDRYQDAQEAIADILTRFSAAGAPLTDFEIHVRAMHLSSATTPAWSGYCWSYFRSLPVVDLAAFALASKLKADVFANSSCPAVPFFDLMNSSAGMSQLRAGGGTFDDSDAIGVLYRHLCPKLDAQRRLLCFEEVARAALKYHRYSLMGDVRRIYSIESDATVRVAMMTVLNTIDPFSMIEGRGVLPRTP